MGQRLNIEICYDGETLANAYYHWSAYTSSSLDLLDRVLNAYGKTKEIKPLNIAVDILQMTGAGVNESEMDRIKKDTTGKFEGIKFDDAVDRNFGLLSVTKEGIEDTRRWEEGYIIVDISKEEFIFDVMWRMNNSEYEEDTEDSSIENLPDAYFNFEDPCPFRDFDKFVKAVKDNPDGVRIDEDTVLCWIK